MAWTYDPSNLDTSDLYQVRFEIGDTKSEAPIFQDEELEHALAVEGNVLGAAARCCETIARTMLRKADVRMGRGGTSLTYSTAAQQYTEMATALRARANATAGAPWAGGRSQAEKETAAEQVDLVQPIFTKTMMDNPLTNSGDSGTPGPPDRFGR